MTSRQEMDGRPLVSIITPVRNRVSMIQQCLASVSNQTYPAVEHIVVDGSSTDGTLEVLEAFRSRHHYRFISEPDRGMYDAINKGLALAQGSIVAYLNSDDIYLPWSVDAAVEGLSRGTTFVYGDLGVLKIQSTEDTAFYIQFYRAFDLNFYTHFETLAQPTVFWLRDATRRIGTFDTSYRLLGDCEYWLRAASRGETFRHLHEILAIQVEHAGTLRQTSAEDLRHEFRKLRDGYREVAGAPQGIRVHPLRRRIAWRKNQFLFLLAAIRRRPRRWPRFLEFLRIHRVPIRPTGFLWFLLPERLRPEAASLIDPVRLTGALQKQVQGSASH